MYNQQILLRFKILIKIVYLQHYPNAARLVRKKAQLRSYKNLHNSRLFKKKRTVLVPYEKKHNSKRLGEKSTTRCASTIKSTTP